MNVTDRVSTTDSTEDIASGNLQAVALFFLTCSVVGIIGNIFVIFGVSISKKLWNATGVLISNLAVADLLACLMAPWHTVAMLSSKGKDPPFPDFICSTVAVTVVVCVGCSMYTLSVIGINRVLLLSNHKAYKYLFEKRKLVLILIVLWLIPFVITVMPLLLGLGKVGYNKDFNVCTQLSEPKLYDKILSLGMCPIPYLTIMICYWRVYCLLSKHSSKMAKMSPIEQPLSSVDNHLNPDNNG